MCSRKSCSSCGSCLSCLKTSCLALQKRQFGLRPEPATRPLPNKLITQNSKPKTHHSSLKTQNSKLKTQNSKLKTLTPATRPLPNGHKVYVGYGTFKPFQRCLCLVASLGITLEKQIVGLHAIAHFVQQAVQCFQRMGGR